MGNSVDMPVLAQATLELARLREIHPACGYRESVMLRGAWTQVLDMCGSWALGPIDWGDVRTLFWSTIPEELMYSGEFRAAVFDIVSEICGAEEALNGLRRVFAVYPG